MSGLSPFPWPAVVFGYFFNKWRAKSKRKAQLRAAAMHVEEVVDYSALTEKRRGKAWERFDYLGYIYLGKCRFYSYVDYKPGEDLVFDYKECVCRIEEGGVRMYTLENPFLFFLRREKPTPTDVVFPVRSFQHIKGTYYKDDSEGFLEITFCGDDPSVSTGCMDVRTDRGPKVYVTNALVLLYEGLHGRRTDY